LIEQKFKAIKNKTKKPQVWLQNKNQT
jgi:hypothetical protein